MEHIQKKDKEGLLASYGRMYEQGIEQMKKLRADGQKWQAEAEKLKAEAQELKAEGRKWKADAEDWKAEAEKLRTSKARADDMVEFLRAKANEPIDAQVEKWKAEAEKRKADAIEVKAGMLKAEIELIARAEKAETEAREWKSMAEEWKPRITPARKSPYQAQHVGRAFMSKAEVDESVAAGDIWRVTPPFPAVEDGEDEEDEEDAEDAEDALVLGRGAGS